MRVIFPNSPLERSETGSDDESMDVPEDAAHVVAMDRFSTAAPEDHDDDRRVYNAGDEIPFDTGIEAVEKHPRTLAVLNTDGELVAGARGISDRELEDVLEKWHE